MNIKNKKILGIVAGIIVLIPLVLACFIMFTNGAHKQSRDCEMGPLTKMTDCIYDENNESWISDAKGELDGEACDIVTDGEDQLSFIEKVDKKTNKAVIYKVSCENFGPQISGTCYASQRAADDDSSRYVRILMVEDCENARYFEGSKYTIQEGLRLPYNWTLPIPNIPDEKTGKIEPSQVYGEILPKSGLSRRG